MTRDEARLRKRRMAKGRKGGRPSLWEKKSTPPPDTSYTHTNLDLRCLSCDRIFNGPHTGEVVKVDSKRYHDLQEMNRAANNYESGGVSDATCGRRSCIDKVATDHYTWARAKAPDRDFTQAEEDFRQELYQKARDDKNRFPEGFVDDVEPPL